MILVTGGTGFIGQHLLAALCGQPEPVRVLLRQQHAPGLPEEFRSRVECVEGDLLDLASLDMACAGVNKVYHAAAMVSFMPRDRQRMMKVNVEGTANLLQASRDAGVGKFLHFSSIAALGRDVLQKEVNEQTEWKKSRLNTQYALSKFRAEREVWRARAEGLPVVIINPSVVIGPGPWDKGTGRFFTNCWNGLPAYVPGGTGLVDVRDVAALAVQLMESDLEGERFILNGTNIRYRDFFFLICDALGKPRPRREAKPWMAELLWRWHALRYLFTHQEPLVTRETARVSMQQFFYSNKKIGEALHYTFRPLEETIRDTSGQFLKEHTNLLAG